MPALFQGKIEGKGNMPEVVALQHITGMAKTVNRVADIYKYIKTCLF